MLGRPLRHHPSRVARLSFRPHIISQTPLRHREEAALGRGVDGKRAAARRGGRRRDEGFVHILQGASVAKGLK